MRTSVSDEEMYFGEVPRYILLHAVTREVLSAVEAEILKGPNNVLTRSQLQDILYHLTP